MPAPDSGSGRPAAPLAGPAGLFALVAGVVLALYVHRYPVGLPPWPALSVPEPGKLATLLRTAAALVVLDLAALGLAGPLRGVLPARSEGRVLCVVTRLALGLVGLANGVLLLGLFGALSHRALVVLLLLGLLLGLPDAVRGARSLSRLGQPLRRHALPVAGFALCLAVPFLSAFVPTFGWDATVYHLALPERFLDAGCVYVSEYSVYTTFPLLAEMLYTLALDIDGPALVKLLHLQFGVLSLGVVFALAVRFAPAAAWVAGVALLCDPLFLWEMTVVKSDLALGLFTLLAAAAVAEWTRAGSRAAAVRAALLCGACVASRYQGAFVPLALGGAALLARGPDWRGKIRLVVGLGAGSLLLMSPWLLRNLLATGSALGLSLFDPVLLRQMVAFSQGIGMGRGLPELLLGPWNVTMRTVPDAYRDSFGSQVGPLYLLLAVAAVVVPQVRRERHGALWLVSAGLLYVFWFFSSQESRYLLPLFPLLVLAGAAGWQHLMAAGRLAPRLGLVVLPLVALVHGQLTFWSSLGPTYGVALGPIPAREVAFETPTEEVGEALRHELPPGARILPFFESRGWHLRGLDYVPYHVNQGSPALLQMHAALGEGRFCGWLEQRGITHVLINLRLFSGSSPIFVEGYDSRDYERDMVLFQRFLQRSGTQRLYRRGIELYEIAGGDACLDAELPP